MAPVAVAVAAALDASNARPRPSRGARSTDRVGYGGGLGRATRGEKKTSKYLSGCVDNLRGIVLVLVLDHLAKRVLNGRIVAVYKMAVDKLHRHTRLAWGVRQYVLRAACCGLHVKVAHATRLDVPTALLPTMAIFLCLGGAMVLRRRRGIDEGVGMATGWPG